MAIKSVEILHQSINVEVSNIVVQSASNIPAEAIGSALELASRAGATQYSYDGDKIISITYNNFRGVNDHTKTLSYSGDKLSTITETFTYGDDTWTYQSSFTYAGDKLSSKSATLTVI